MTLNYSAEFHATVQVADLDRAKKFYTENLELKLVEDIPQVGWASVQTAVDGAKVGLSKPQEGDPVATNAVNLHVSNASNARDALKAKGIETSDLIHYPGMISMFTIQDPDKNTITFIAPPEQTD